jgi:hypothetical protein
MINSNCLCYISFIEFSPSVIFTNIFLVDICMKVIYAAFCTLSLALYFFCARKIGWEGAHKMLVKLTTDFIPVFFLWSIWQQNFFKVFLETKSSLAYGRNVYCITDDVMSTFYPKRLNSNIFSVVDKNNQSLT